MASALWLLLASCAREPIRVGMVAGLSGSQAELGIAIRDGAILATEELNAAGGIRGRRLELVIKDDRNEEAELAEALAALRAQGVKVVIGPATSAMAIKALELAPDFLFVSPTASAERLAGKDDGLVRLMASNARAAAALGRKVRARNLARSVAAAWDRGNESYAKDYLAAFAEAWTEAGGEPPLEEAFSGKGGEPELERVARILASSGREAVLLVAGGADAATLIRLLERSGYRGLVMVSGWSVTSDIAAFGSRALEGVIFSQQYHPDSKAPEILAFREAFSKRFGARAGFGAIFSYEATRCLADALAETRSESPERLKAAILSAGPRPGLEGPVVFDATGDPDREAFVFRFSGGEAGLLE